MNAAIHITEQEIALLVDRFYAKVLQSRTLNRRQLQAGDISRRIECRCLRQAQHDGHQVNPVVRGSAGEHALIVLGKALRLHRRLAATVEQESK